MSWHYSQALEAAYLEANSSGGEPSARLKSTTIAAASLCSARTTESSFHFQSGMMCEPSTDVHGEAVLTWFLAASRAKHSAARLEERTTRQISGRRCDGSWQMSLPDLSSRKTLAEKPSMPQRTTLKRWVTPPEPLPLVRRTWVLTTFGSDTGLLHTPTTTANYACPSMQKWPNCRAYSRVFGQPDPENHEWLMGWPIGWSASRPLETGRFRAWLRSHGQS